MTHTQSTKTLQTYKKPKKLDRIGAPGARYRAPGALKGGLFRFFKHPLLQNIKKMEGSFRDFFSKKVSQCRNKLKGGPFSLSRYCMLRGKTRTTFLVQFARPNDSIWGHKIL